jgi:Protein of unknown function (DUF2934)
MACTRTATRGAVLETNIPRARASYESAGGRHGPPGRTSKVAPSARTGQSRNPNGWRPGYRPGLERFAEEIKAKLDDLQGAVKREATGRRAFELWHKAGRPEGRDLEFWLRAEGEQPGSCRTSTGTSPAAWNREQADDLNPGPVFPPIAGLHGPPPLSPEAPRGEPVPSREDHMAHVYEDDIRARA